MLRKFYGRLPVKPYCTNDLQAGLKIWPRAAAVKCRYIQLNPPGQVWALVFDVDCETWELPQRLGLPSPTWQVYNPENGHGHLVWALERPVITTEAARLHPLRYLAAIQAAYRQRLGADPAYTGLITKNPDQWPTLRFDVARLYTLAQLADAVREELKKPQLRKPHPDSCADLGRNCYVFETVRLWSYRAIRGYWGQMDGWTDAVEAQCEAVNSTFPYPLEAREVGRIAKSIAAWTAQRFTPETFSKLQKARINLRWHNSSQDLNPTDQLRADNKVDALSLLDSGMPVADVAKVLGVHPATVRKWRGPADTLTSREPWKEEGISRRTWYYRRAK